MQKKKEKKLMKTDVKPMKQGLLSQIFHLYYDGFRTMTLGKTLWTIILIKLAIIFLVLKLFFFPDFFALVTKNAFFLVINLKSLLKSTYPLSIK